LNQAKIPVNTYACFSESHAKSWMK
jgi:hypothetical protein